jgi:hypothetical protein
MYLIACIPAIVGAVLWITNKKFNAIEWVVSAGAAFAVAGIIHASVVAGITADVETWSGQMSKAVHHPKWVEKYQKAVYKTESYTTTVGSGKNRRTVTRTRSVFSHYETRYRTHHKHWVAHISYGTKSTTQSISEGFYNQIKKNWGGEKCQKTVNGYRPGFYSGDRNDYVLQRKTDYIYPAVTTYHFENRVKAAPSVFSFPKVPEGTKVHPYPKHPSWRQSCRLLGHAPGPVSILEWDRMNARLGPRKKVNVILIGFGRQDSSIAHMQEAKWIGGKKNDLVICYGDDKEKTTWAYVFGWTEKEIVKRNLETILLDNPVDNGIIPLVENEIMENYSIKEWEKFNYISVEPPTYAYLILLGVMLVTQSGIYAWALLNRFNKKGER